LHSAEEHINGSAYCLSTRKADIKSQLESSVSTAGKLVEKRADEANSGAEVVLRGLLYREVLSQCLLSFI
jgi:hypothetical protein